MAHPLTKPALVATFAAAGDRIFLKDTDMTRNVYFGIAVGAGVLLADVFGSKVLPASEYKTLETRIAEVGFGATGALAIDRFIMNSNVYRVDIPARLGLIVASEVAADYAKKIIYNEM